MFYRVVPCRGKCNLNGLRPNRASNFRAADDSLRMAISRSSKCCEEPTANRTRISEQNVEIYL
jgi:hypothetical protein